MSERSWQDVMIENFGGEWVRHSYDVVDMGKLAGRVIDLEQRLKEANEVIGHYDPDGDNFTYLDVFDCITINGQEKGHGMMEFDSDMFGKQARNYMAKRSGGKDKE